MLTLMSTLFPTPYEGPREGTGSLRMLWGYPYRNNISVDNICKCDMYIFMY